MRSLPCNRCILQRSGFNYILAYNLSLLLNTAAAVYLCNSVLLYRYDYYYSVTFASYLFFIGSIL